MPVRFLAAGARTPVPRVASQVRRACRGVGLALNGNLAGIPPRREPISPGTALRCVWGGAGANATGPESLSVLHPAAGGAGQCQARCGIWWKVGQRLCYPARRGRLAVVGLRGGSVQ